MVFYDCFKGPCPDPPPTKVGRDGRPRIVCQANFWNSDVFEKMTSWLPW